MLPPPSFSTMLIVRDGLAAVLLMNFYTVFLVAEGVSVTFRSGRRTTANREENWCWASVALLRFPVDFAGEPTTGRIVELH
jgi:hypothetical protein